MHFFYPTIQHPNSSNYLQISTHIATTIMVSNNSTTDYIYIDNDMAPDAHYWSKSVEGTEDMAILPREAFVWFQNPKFVKDLLNAMDNKWETPISVTTRMPSKSCITVLLAKDIHQFETDMPSIQDLTLQPPKEKAHEPITPISDGVRVANTATSK